MQLRLLVRVKVMKTRAEFNTAFKEGGVSKRGLNKKSFEKKNGLGGTR